MLSIHINRKVEEWQQGLPAKVGPHGGLVDPWLSREHAGAFPLMAGAWQCKNAVPCCRAGSRTRLISSIPQDLLAFRRPVGHSTQHCAAQFLVISTDHLHQGWCGGLLGDFPEIIASILNWTQMVTCPKFPAPGTRHTARLQVR